MKRNWTFIKIWSKMTWRRRRRSMRNDYDHIEQLITSLEQHDDNSIIGYWDLIGRVSDVLNKDSSICKSRRNMTFFFSSLTEKKIVRMKISIEMVLTQSMTAVFLQTLTMIDIIESIWNIARGKLQRSSEVHSIVRRNFTSVIW